MQIPTCNTCMLIALYQESPLDKFHFGNFHIMYKVTGRKSLRDQVSEALASPGMELRSFDILEDDFTRLYIIQADYWGGGRCDFESQGFRAEMREVLPDAECICSRAIASAYLIIFKEEL